jgi:hypothetical protein
MSTSCDGPVLVCNSAEFGEYDSMVSCPDGYVMLESTTFVETFLGDATVENKTCVPSCTDDSDCRVGEYDDVWGADAEYECVLDHDPIRFCYDARNLGEPTDYSVTQF